MLNQWEQQYPGRIESMFTAMKNVVPSHLCDNSLFDFKTLDSSSTLPHGGDTAFDKEVFTSNTKATNEKYVIDSDNLIELT